MDKEHSAMLVGTCDAQGKKENALEEEYTKWITNEKLRENGQVNTYDSSGNSQSVNSSGSMNILETRGVRTRAEVVGAHISPKRIRLELPPVESTD
ncbi:predicted protein [Botrytis cinerea T4]|uniref:Uncharacterized protein n=1 Tax=Botryotinia fuckeliana (strain T4) TaxID=999810 RepID=G2YAN1_BOTF4|nr:predicted protein [Botrytis cinerea T4]